MPVLEVGTIRKPSQEKKIYSMLFGVQRIYHQVSQGKREKKVFQKNLGVILCPIPQFFFRCLLYFSLTFALTYALREGLQWL
jgi:hypothetical protein